MKKLTTLLVSILVCGSAFANSQYAVITGYLGHRGICLEMPCALVDYVILTNDTASFFLVKNGQMLISPHELGNFSIGDVISIYGVVSKKTDYDNREYYELRVISVYIHATITGEIGRRQTPRPVGVPGPPVATFVTQITNDTTSFVLLKNGRMLNHPQELGNFSDGDIVSVYGYYFISNHLGTNFVGGNDFYFLEIIEILRSETSEREININQIQISPNPTDGQITISGIENFDNAIFELFDLSGSLIQSGVLSPTINLSALQGIYLFTITQNQRVIAQERIVVK